MNLYLDASALVKRYVEEDGSEAIGGAMSGADELISCRLAFVETLLAVQAKAGAEGVKAFRGDWEFLEVLEIDRTLCKRAAGVGMKHGLRTLDSLHLTSALLTSHDVTFASWDHRLHAAAMAEGLVTFPATLG